MTLSALPIFARAALSSGLTLTSERNFMNVSLFVPIWSRYCWTVIPCANRSFVSIGSPCAPRLAHRGEIHGELRDFLFLGVPHHQHHPALWIDPLGGKGVDALRGVPPVLLADRGALVLDEARLHRLRSRNDLGRVKAGEVALAAAQADPEGDPPLGALEQGLHVARVEDLALKRRMARGQGEAVKRRHYHDGLSGAVLDAPFRAELIRDDALLAGTDRLIAVTIRERERHRSTGRRGDQPHRQHQERKTPVP